MRPIEISAFVLIPQGMVQAEGFGNDQSSSDHSGRPSRDDPQQLVYDSRQVTSATRLAGFLIKMPKKNWP